jgi:hypothetical protein
MTAGYPIVSHTQLPIYTLENRLPSKTLLGTQISYNININCENEAYTGQKLDIEIPIPSGFKLVHHKSNEGLYNPETGIWTLKLKNNTATLNLILQPLTPGLEKQTIKLLQDATKLTTTTEILQDDIGELYYNIEHLSDYTDTINNLQDGKLYTITKYSYLDVSKALDGAKNGRLSVINGIETIGEKTIQKGHWEKITVTFTYNQNEPITIREYGQYTPNKSNTEMWAGLCIKEGLDSEYSESQPVLSDPTAFLDNKKSTNLKLPSEAESAVYIYTIKPLKLPEKDKPIITGLELNINNNNTHNPTIKTWITNEQSQSSTIKTQPLNQRGNMTDLWQLKNKDLNHKHLYLHLAFQNNTLNTQKYIYSNLNLKTYWIDDIIQNLPGFTYNNVHSRNYQIYYDNDNNQQLDLDLETLDYPTKDGTVPIRLNIAPKELEISFNILGDTLEETQNKYQHISNWLLNKRNNINIPIKSKLILDYQPNLVYDVILKKIEVEKKISTYHCKATFLVPDGVGYTYEPIITGPIGINQGKTPIKPLLTLKTLGSSNIIISDTISGQSITLNVPLPPDLIIYCNCKDRTVTTEHGEDLTNFMGLNSVWFKFHHNYNLECTGAIIQSVEFCEGY